MIADFKNEAKNIFKNLSDEMIANYDNQFKDVLSRLENKISDVLSKQNLHIMDKHFLTSDNFKSIIDKVCKWAKDS